MGLLALAIAPGIAICLFIYFKDKYNKEPRKYLMLSFLLGILSTIPAIFIEVYGGKVLDQYMTAGYVYTAISAYLVVAFTEEICKFAMVRIFDYPRKAFDDPFDGIIYTVMVGMGFATLENIFYVMQHGYVVGIMRLLFSVPGHATFAVIMGYYIGLAKFKGRNSFWYMFLGVFWATVFHGTYDYFLFLPQQWYHIVGALTAFLIAFRLSFVAIRRKQAMSKAFFEAQAMRDLGAGV
jgi:protease PrsW